MIDNIEVLAAIVLAGVLPFAGLAFCYWRMVASIAGRCASNSRRRARYVSIYAVVVTVIAGLYALGGLAASGAALLNVGLSIEMLAAAAPGLIGVLIGLSTVPAFRVVGQLQRLDSDTQDQLEIEIDRSTGWLEVCGWGYLFLSCVTATSMVGIMLIPGLMFLVLVLPTLVWYRRRHQEAQLLWLLALGIRQNRDLSTELENLAGTFSGFYACRLRELASHLRDGRSVATSLMLCRPEPLSALFWVMAAIFSVLSLGFGLLLVFVHLVLRNQGLVPAWCLTEIRVAEEAGTLEASLTDCATRHLNWMKERFHTTSISGIVFYIFGYLFAVTAIVSFLCYWIVPKFKKIFEDFGVELPDLTVAFVSFADLVTFLMFGPLFPVAVAVPILLLWIIVVDHNGWRNLRLRLFAPFYRWFDTSDILRQLSRTIERRQPITDGLLAIANHHHRPVIAETLARILPRVEGGADCWTQLRQHGFLTGRDLAVIEAAERTGNLVWALREIATSRERRLKYRLDAWLIVLRPVCILAIGSLVAFVTIAMFLPLYKLVDDLS
ncbi:MAG: type II secretion system F family protein [Planctomycetota bacterium]|jgi:type II secretory pathway component PulF